MRGDKIEPGHCTRLACRAHGPADRCWPGDPETCSYVCDLATGRASSLV